MATIDTNGGGRLHAAIAGAGRPLVLVHGWSLSHRAFAPQLSQLAAGFRVIAPDLRGHGASRSPELARTVDDFAGDLAAVLAALDVEDALVAGWSWGAEIALAALPSVRDRLAGLALISATPRFTAGEGWEHGLPESRVRALRARLARAPDDTRRAFFDAMFADGELDPAAKDRLAAEQLAVPPDVGAARAALDALAAADLRDRLAPARELPVLLVHGDADGVCLPGASAWLAAQLPRSRRAVLAGVGHAPQLSRPEAVSALVAGFAEELA
ncbi:MAG TPA: alpha/beta hydrolase [Anaeromyxobacteraceae bacterium]|nr:alpha/beta hydrolase [Anaeromyxobacteraceae bacterium]